MEQFPILYHAAERPLAGQEAENQISQPEAVLERGAPLVALSVTFRRLELGTMGGVIITPAGTVGENEGVAINDSDNVVFRDAYAIFVYVANGVPVRVQGAKSLRQVPRDTGASLVVRLIALKLFGLGG